LIRANLAGPLADVTNNMAGNFNCAVAFTSETIGAQNLTITAACRTWFLV
jgi:hypothetical protein